LEDCQKKTASVAFEIKQKSPLYKIGKILFQDIYSTHKWFIWSKYHYKEYKFDEFISNIEKNSNILNNNNLINNNNNFINEINSHNIINFSPEYVINDSIIDIFSYIFNITQYINEIQNQNKKVIIKDFKLLILIRCKQIQSVYDENIIFNDNISDIKQYLNNQNINYYNNIIDKKSSFNIKEYIVNDNINKLFIIIDRKHSDNDNDVLYIIANNNDDNNLEYSFKQRYYFGFNFFIKDGGKTVISYLLYGINNFIRFYSEMLQDLIPKLFVLSEFKGKDKYLYIYNSSFKNGISVTLYDDIYITV